MLKTNRDNNKNERIEKQAEPKKQDKPTDLSKEIILNALPLYSDYPTLVKYSAVPSLHYVVYSA